MDDRPMTQISTLVQVDPVFREVVSKLYPALDPRELWDLAKAMPDQSATHVNNNESRNKKALAGGLLFGATAEGAATYQAGKNAFKKKPSAISPGQGTLFPKPKTGLKDSLRGLKETHGGKAGFALQATNLAVGLGAARELIKKPKKQTIPKRAPEDALEFFQPIIKARQNGQITTEQALKMIEDVEKGILDSQITRTLIRYPKEVKQLIRYPHALPASKKNPKQFEELATKSHEQTNQALAGGRLIVGGIAGGGAVAYGVHRGKKKAAKEVIPKRLDDEVDYEFTGEISKVDPDKRQVFGWCSLSSVNGQPVVDLQNDYISIEEIEKSAYDYVKTSRKGGDMHARVGSEPMHVSDLIESVIVTPEKLEKMGVPQEAISKVNTGWWVGFSVNDEAIWAKVKSGERTGFSIHGKGARVEKVLND